MRIEILGAGCAKCRKVEMIISEVVSKARADVEVVHVSDMHEIVERGVMLTPAVFVDGELKLEGRIPDESLVRSWLGLED